jgi:hypothetical protein
MRQQEIPQRVRSAVEWTARERHPRYTREAMQRDEPSGAGDLVVVTAIPLDTSPQAHGVQRDVYIRMGGAGRVAVMFGLNETVRRLAMAGIRARHPEYDEENVRRAYGRLVLGDDLARAVWPDRELVEP